VLLLLTSAETRATIAHKTPTPASSAQTTSASLTQLNVSPKAAAQSLLHTNAAMATAMLPQSPRTVKLAALPPSNALTTLHTFALMVNVLVMLHSAKSNFLAQWEQSDAVTELALLPSANATLKLAHQRDQFSVALVLALLLPLNANKVQTSALLPSHSNALLVSV
jgi:hypothetical protein